MKLIHTILFTLPLLAACGTPPTLTASPIHAAPMATREHEVSTAPADAQPLKFQSTTLEALTSSAWNSRTHDGALVTFQGSFGPEQYGTYGLLCNGYKIWDHAGNGLRCQNIYSYRDKSGKMHDVGDFKPEARWILNYGTFVTIEGAYHAAPELNQKRATDKSATALVEPTIDVYFINGQPVKDLVVNYAN